MIFILKESLMNGTVSLNTSIYGFDCESFDLVKEKIKSDINNFPGMRILEDSNVRFSYCLVKDFTIISEIENKELLIRKI
jgi:hypothetical protein